MKSCILFVFFLFFEFQLYSSASHLDQLNPNGNAALEENCFVKKKSSHDWANIAKLMNKIHEKENQRLLTEQESKNFVSFLQSNYNSKERKFYFRQFIEKHQIQKICSKIFSMIVKLSESCIDSRYVGLVLRYLNREYIEQLQPNQMKKLSIIYFTPEQLTWFGSKIIHFSISDNDYHNNEIVKYVEQNYKKENDNDNHNTSLLWLLTKIDQNFLYRYSTYFRKKNFYLYLDQLNQEQSASFNYNQIYVFIELGIMQYL